MPASTSQPGLSGPEQLERFLAGPASERTFSHPTCHPSGKTGFCPCDGPLLSKTWFYLRAAVLLNVLKLPFNRPKIALLRAAGAKIGNHVYLSADVWIDPAFPQLLTIEDNVMLGVGAKISMHEFTPDEFRAGRVVVRCGAVIGGHAMIGPGVEIGENAAVSAAAAVGRDVPAGYVAIGNPARCFPRRPKAHAEAARRSSGAEPPSDSAVEKAPCANS